MSDVSKEEFLHSLFVLKSLLGAAFAKSSKTAEQTLNMPEYVLMKMVSEATDGRASLTHIREYLAVSKAAVSQMLSSLEKRGFVNREIDRANRRNLVVTVTAAGAEVLRQKDMEADSRLEKIISRLGIQDTAQFVRLIERMNAAVEAPCDD